MSHSDSNFYKFIMVVANMVSPKSPDDPLAVEMLKKSIEPVGQSRVVEVAEPKADTSAEADSAKTEDTAVAQESTATTEATDKAAGTEAAEAAPAETKKEAVPVTKAAATSTSALAGGAVSMKVKATVATNCAGCHNAGLDGAAKPDDSEAWSALSSNGLDALTASVINGKGEMPARAESSLSDDEIKQAVQLMISNATGSDAAGSATASATTTAKATTAAATTTASAATTEAVKVADASAATSEIPAAVKQVVDTACAACHLTGVASAPKYGDKDAWAPRMEKGVDGLTASAIAGIGVMPARGGSSLDDEQMKLAVEYMLSK